jgi:hypothetical protein
MKRIAIIGSRDFNDYSAFEIYINNIICEDDELNFDNPNNILIVSGGCSGVDSMAERWAKEHKYKTLIFKPEWSKYGKAAGPLRNTLIIENSDVIIAFPSKKSVGTYDTINKAKALHKKVVICNV